MNHVALLIPGLDKLGGAERQVLLLAAGLRRRGWRVSVVALSGRGGEAASRLVADDVGFLSLGMRKGLADPRGWIRFNRWLRRERPDVVHGHLPHAAWLGRWSRLAAPVPFLLDTLHSSATGGVGRRLGYRLSKRLPHRVTAVSQSVADTHLKARMVSPGSLKVVPNGVDVRAFRPDAETRATVRRELGLADEFLWLAVGRLEPVKDYPTLLRAMTGLPEPARLLIAGDGPCAGELRALADRLGLGSRIRFLGFAAPVERWMQAADGFVLSSLWEGLPSVLLEAAACALPAVATDVPGSREAIFDARWLVPPGDTAALSTVMAKLMRIVCGERIAMGASAREHVIKHFSLEAVLDQWEQLYRDSAG